MKRIMSMILAVAFIMVLSGCGSDDEAQKSATTKKTDATTTIPKTFIAETETFADDEQYNNDYVYGEDYADNGYGSDGGYYGYDYDYDSGDSGNYDYNIGDSGNEQVKTTKKKTGNSGSSRLTVSSQDIGYLFDNINLGFKDGGGKFKNETDYTVTSVEYQEKSNSNVYKYDKAVKPNATVNLSKTGSKKYYAFTSAKLKDSNGNEFELFRNELNNIYTVRVIEKSGKKYTYWYDTYEGKIKFVYDEKNDYSDIDYASTGIRALPVSPSYIDSMISKIYDGVNITSTESYGDYTNYITFTNKTEYRISYISMSFLHELGVYDKDSDIEIRQNITPNHSSSKYEIDKYGLEKKISKKNIADFFVKLDDGSGKELYLNSSSYLRHGNQAYDFEIKNSNGNEWNFTYDYVQKKMIDITYNN